jgi:hypothetical protein
LVSISTNGSACPPGTTLSSSTTPGYISQPIELERAPAERARAFRDKVVVPGMQYGFTKAREQAPECS